MCNAEIKFDGANDPERCQCRSAVLKAYHALKETGHPESDALTVAKRVYKFHHPEDMPDDAALTVERWVYAEHFH